MNRLALADPGLTAPRSYPELVEKRVFIGGAHSPLGALAAHAFAAQDCRLILQGAGGDGVNSGVGDIASELSDTAHSVRVFSGVPQDAHAAARLADASLKAHDGLDVAVVILDLTAAGLTRAIAGAEITGDDDIGIGQAFASALTIGETVAERMARAGGGTVAYLAQVDRTLDCNPLTTLARVGLEEIVTTQMEDWEDAGVRFIAIAVEDPDDDTAALEASGALLLTASGRGDWLEGVVVSV